MLKKLGLRVVASVGCFAVAHAESLSANIDLIRGACPSFELVNVDALVCGRSPEFGDVCVIDPTPGTPYDFTNTNIDDLFCRDSDLFGFICRDNTWSPYFVNGSDEPTFAESGILWRNGYQIRDGVDLGYVEYAASGNNISASTTISTSGANTGRATVTTKAELLEFVANINAPFRECNTPKPPSLHATNSFRYSANIDTNVEFKINPNAYPIGTTIEIPFRLEIEQRTDRAIVNVSSNAIIRDLNVNTLANVRLRSNPAGGNNALDGTFSFVYDGTSFVANLIWRAENSRLTNAPVGISPNSFITDDVARFKFGQLPAGIACEGIDFAIESCGSKKIAVLLIVPGIGPITEVTKDAEALAEIVREAAAELGTDVEISLRSPVNKPIQLALLLLGQDIVSDATLNKPTLIKRALRFLSDTAVSIFLENVARVYEAERQASRDNIQDVVSYLETNRQNEIPTVIIAYSSGSILANAAFEEFATTAFSEKVILGYIAPTEDEIADNIGRWTTEVEDRVVLATNGLPWTVDNNDPLLTNVLLLDLIGHDLRKFYTRAGSPALTASPNGVQAVIENALRRAMEELE